MSILVTGGLGFVGSHFVWESAASGLEIVVLDLAQTGPSLPESVRVVTGDIADRELVARVVREHRVRACVHFAGRIQVGESVRAPRLYFDANVTRSLALLDVLLDAGVDRFVFSSTAAVYGTPPVVPIPESSPRVPINPYGDTKLTLERALDAYGVAYGLRWAALRYFNAAGAHPSGTLREAHDPETHLLPLVIDAGLGRRPPLSLFGTDYETRDGTCIRDYVHVMDLAAAHVAALALLETRSIGPLNLGTGLGCSVREVLDAARDVLGHPIPHDVGPRRPGDPASLVADASAARDLLGFSPRRSDLRVLLEDTLRSRR
jgi:UDP-glucose-4-epimerase GalE